MKFIEESFSKKQYAASIFLDIKGAFDYTWRPAILAALHRRGCPLYLIRVFASSLRGRRAVLTAHKVDLEVDISLGDPQGGILHHKNRAVTLAFT